MEDKSGHRVPIAAVHSIDHFALNVPSLDEARRFFTSFGLDVQTVGHGATSELDLRALDGHRWARILPSTSKSLSYLSFSCFDGGLESIRSRVIAAGGRMVDDVAAATGTHYSQTGLWFRDPDGNVVHVSVGPKTTPYEKTIHTSRSVPPDSRGAPQRSMTKMIRPRRMSHVLLFTPDINRAVEFYEGALGLKLTDRSPDVIAFMHAVHGSDHHLIAFAKSSAKGWHHVAWDVDTIDDVGIGASQMAAAGYGDGWGTGRHVLGSNYFHYVRDPWGSFCEYSADIDFVTPGTVWPTGDFAPEDSLYVWGPDVPQYFIHNTEA